MTLNEWYGFHDEAEKVLRELERADDEQLSDFKVALWAAHDELERVIIREQSLQTEEELDKHE